MDCPGELELFWIKSFRKLGIKGDIQIHFLSGCFFHIYCYEYDLGHNESILKPLMNTHNAFGIRRNSNQSKYDITFNDYQILPKLFKKMLAIAVEEEKKDKGSWGITWRDYPAITPMHDKLERVKGKGFELVDYDILNDEGVNRTLQLFFRKGLDDEMGEIMETVSFDQVYTN